MSTNVATRRLAWKPASVAGRDLRHSAPPAWANPFGDFNPMRGVQYRWFIDDTAGQWFLSIYVEGGVEQWFSVWPEVAL